VTFPPFTALGRGPWGPVVCGEMGESETSESFGPAADRARRLFEVPVLVAALLVVPVIFIEERAVSAAWQTVAAVANWIIWGLFVAEYSVVVALAADRWKYTKRAWLDVFIIVSSFPLLGVAVTRLLRLVRVVRVFRLLRLVRLAAVISRGGAAAGVIFRKRGLGYIVVLTLLIAMGVGGVFALVEGSAVVDGLWWAIVTLTTVGYGDMFPVTPAGRMAAAVLMLLGIGFVAVITASVAAHFVGSDQESELTEELRAIHQRLDRLDNALVGGGGAAGAAQMDAEGE
jgi:voltage-gated potassium channel